MLGRWYFIDAAEIIEVHHHAMARFGQTATPPSQKCIESCVDNSINASLYESDYEDEPDLLIGIAYLLVYIAKNHCFVDGNKRTAWASAERVFLINDLVISGDEEEAADLVNGVVEKRFEVTDLLRWFKQPKRLRSKF